MDALKERRQLPDIDEWSEFVRSLAGESDRAVPIVFMAYIDSQIETMLRDELNPYVASGLDDLLGQEGLLGTFGSRVKLCQAVGWVSNDLAHDLNLLRKVRNEFAHAAQVTFDSAHVTGWLSSLKFLAGVQALAHELAPHTYSKEEGGQWTNGRRVLRTRRLDFIMAAAFALVMVAVELYVGPSSERSGLDLGQASEDTPEWFKSFQEAASVEMMLASLDSEAARQALRPPSAQGAMPVCVSEWNSPITTSACLTN